MSYDEWTHQLVDTIVVLTNCNVKGEHQAQYMQRYQTLVLGLYQRMDETTLPKEFEEIIRQIIMEPVLNNEEVRQRVEKGTFAADCNGNASPVTILAALAGIVLPKSREEWQRLESQNQGGTESNNDKAEDNRFWENEELAECWKEPHRGITPRRWINESAATRHAFHQFRERKQPERKWSVKFCKEIITWRINVLRDHIPRQGCDESTEKEIRDCLLDMDYICTAVAEYDRTMSARAPIVSRYRADFPPLGEAN